MHAFRCGCVCGYLWKTKCLVVHLDIDDFRTGLGYLGLRTRVSLEKSWPVYQWRLGKVSKLCRKDEWVTYEQQEYPLVHLPSFPKLTQTSTRCRELVGGGAEQVSCRKWLRGIF